VLAKTGQLFPGAWVILVGILPRAEHAEKVAQVDQLIRACADERTVFYFDLAAKMTAEGDTWKGLGPDRLHLVPKATNSGRKAWSHFSRDCSRSNSPQISMRGRCRSQRRRHGEPTCYFFLGGSSPVAPPTAAA